MRQEGRGIGLANKLKAYSLQDCGHDTVEANIALGSPRPQGLRDRRPDTQGHRCPQDAPSHEQPEEDKGPRGYGLTVVERVPIEMVPTKDNIAYLTTKQKKLGHILNNI